MTATGAVSRRCLLSHVSHLPFAASSCGALGRRRTQSHVTSVTIAYLAKEAWRNFLEPRKAEVQLPRTPLLRTRVNRGLEEEPGPLHPGPFRSLGAFLLTSCFLTLPLAFLSLLLPDLLALLSLLRVPLQILLYTLRLALALQLLKSRPPLRLRLVRSPVHAVLLLVGLARSRRNCSQRGAVQPFVHWSDRLRAAAPYSTAA